MPNPLRQTPYNRPERPAGAPMAKALIDTLRATQCTIVAEDDPKHPGKTTYRISGRDRETVQSAIDKTMLQVDTAFGGVAGVADFEGPVRMRVDLYVALGVVIRHA